MSVDHGFSRAIFYFCYYYCVCVCMSLYHPQHHIDGEDRGHPSKWQALEDAAAGVGAVASLSRAVLFSKGIQEAQSAELHSAPLCHGGRSHHKQLRVRHQH